MANITITQLPTAGAITGTELVPIVQNGVTVQTTTGAIAVQPTQTQTFLTATQQSSLTNSRYLAAGSGLSLTDNGSQGTLQINLTGAAQSLDSASTGIQVKTDANTLTARQITVGTGLGVTNGNGVSANPLISLGSFLSNINSLSGSTGLVGVQGGVVNPLAIVGTTSQISVTSGDGSVGNPTVAIASNPVVPGNAAITIPAGTTAQRSGSIGAFRFNSDLGLFEGYGASGWNQFTTGGSGVISIATGTGLTGGPITTTGTISIANTAVSAGSYGSATQSGTFTVNAQGQLTSAASITMTPAWGSITGTPTTLSGYGITDGVSLTGSQTLINKTISGASNTLTNIGNSSLTNSSLTVGTTNIALGGTSLTLAGLTSVALTQNPTSALQAATKQYVDAAISNVNYHAACNYATTADLGSVTYNNGTSGVGATLTNAGTQATLVIDGHTFTGTDVTNAVRILVKNESNAAYNGIYTLTNQGSGSTNWVLTRASDFDQVGTGQNEVAPGDTTFIVSGTINASTQWVQTTDLPITIGTTSIVFVQIGGPGAYTAGTGLTLSGTQFSITNTAVTAASYGSASSVGTFTVNAQGQLTLAGSTSIAINGNQITSGTVGSTYISGSYTGITGVGTLTAGTWNAGTIAAGYGGTGLATYAVGDTIYASGTTTLSKLTIGTSGQVLTSTGTAPQWSTLSGVAVTTFSGGTTGLTPATATSGAITLAGTLATTNGGTNLTSFTSGGAMYATSTSALTTGTLPNTAGGTGQSSAFTQYGVTYASTTTALATTAAGTTTTVLHGNASGAPTFGAVSLTADVSGTLPVANGGTGATTLAGASIVTYTGSETLTNKTLTNPTVTNYTETLYSIGNSSTAVTISLANGTYQTVTMTGNCTFTMPSVGAGKSFILEVNSGAGSFTGTFTSVKWPSNTAPTLTTTASRWDFLAFFSDGTNWYGNYVQAFQ